MIADPVARLFWDMNPSALDPVQHQRVIIPRVLNYGTLSDWQWLERRYGREVLRTEATAVGRNAIRERSRRLAALLFA
jgi:hypothetical protein